MQSSFTQFSIVSTPCKWTRSLSSTREASYPCIKFILARSLPSIQARLRAKACPNPTALMRQFPDEAHYCMEWNLRICTSVQISDLLARELVPGDIVELHAGDRVPADLRVIELRTATLRAEQASLTGESVAVQKVCTWGKGGGGAWGIHVS